MTRSILRLKAYADKRLESLIEPLKAKAYRVNDAITFISADMSHSEDKWYFFRFIFYVQKPIENNLRVYFHGRVDPQNLQYLPENMRVEGYMMWNFNPDPPTKDWTPGDYVVLTQRIQAEPIKYKLKLGFYSDASGFFGASIPLGEIDFSQIPQKKPD